MSTVAILVANVLVIISVAHTHIHAQHMHTFSQIQKYVLLRNTNLELGTLDVDRSLITTIIVQTGYCEIVIHQDLSGFVTTN